VPRTRSGSLSLLPEGVLALLESSSELLGIWIDIRLTSDPRAPSAKPAPSCVACGETDPAIFAACAGNPARMGRPDGSRDAETWVCGRGLDVFSFPIDETGLTPLRLVAVRPCASPQGSPWSRDRTARFLGRLTRLAADHMHLSRDLRKAQGRLAHAHEELSLLCKVTGQLGENENLRSIARQILAQACGVARADAAIVYVAERRFLEIATRNSASSRIAPAAARRWRILGELLAGSLQASGRNFFVGGDAELRPEDPPMGGAARILAVRLPVDGEPRGVLCLVHGKSGPLNKESEIRVLETVAERIGMAITNHDLVENLKEFQMATVKSLVSAIEAKDAYTSGHSERVHILSMLLGKTLELSAAELDVLKWASILHDIGKIGMPGRILNKPGRLTPEEYEIMKEHPERGYKVLAPIHQLAAASLGVRSHHEMIDGRGYPMGLRGEEIPHAARIISVADTYDALTSTRAYRQRRSPDSAFAVIDAVRGTQLDSEIVDALDCLLPFIREHEVMIQTGALEQATVRGEEGKEEAA